MGEERENVGTEEVRSLARAIPGSRPTREGRQSPTDSDEAQDAMRIASWPPPSGRSAGVWPCCARRHCTDWICAAVEQALHVAGLSVVAVGHGATSNYHCWSSKGSGTTSILLLEWLLCDTSLAIVGALRWMRNIGHFGWPPA